MFYVYYATKAIAEATLKAQFVYYINSKYILKVLVHFHDVDFMKVL